MVQFDMCHGRDMLSWLRTLKSQWFKTTGVYSLLLPHAHHCLVELCLSWSLGDLGSCSSHCLRCCQFPPQTKHVAKNWNYAPRSDTCHFHSCFISQHQSHSHISLCGRRYMVLPCVGEERVWYSWIALMTSTGSYHRMEDRDEHH